MSNEYSIAVLLPTRGRTESLTHSVVSIVSQAEQRDCLQILFGFDDDDTIGLEHFESVIQPFLDDQGVDYEAQVFTSLGYEGLHRYYNHLATSANADWMFVWNDDAVMETPAWDRVIRQYNGQFKLLKVHTHNEHPYSIFPIVPKLWFDTLGVLSRHQMIDAEISQNAYMLDVMEIVDITVTHEQSELTGQHDDTSKRKTRFEGDTSNPQDFHFAQTVRRRHEDCRVLRDLMQTMNLDTDFFDRIFEGTQDPWEKLKQNDINGHMFHFLVKV
jgi:hypothetical protein